MKFINTFTVIAAIAALSMGAAAQCDAGGSVACTINGASGLVNAGPGNGLTVAFTDGGSGEGLLIILSSGGLACGSFPTPWGGGIDLPLPGITAVMDGIGNSISPMDIFAHTDLTMTGSVPAGATAGSQPLSIQAVHGTSVAALDNTAAAALNIVANTITAIPHGAIADDGFISHTLTVPITLYGVAHTSLSIGSNGHLSFDGQGTGDFSPSPPEIFGGYGIGHLAGAMADFNRLSQISGGQLIDENPATGSVLVSYLGQFWWDSQLPAGDFHTTFGGVGPGSVEVDMTQMTVGGADQDLYMVVSDGDADGVNEQIDPGIPYNSTANSDSMAYNLGSGGAGAFTWLSVPMPAVCVFVDLSGMGMWTVF